MLSAYPAYFIKEENGYSVIFPDLNNLATCGSTLDEAFMMAMDCLAGYLTWLQEDGEEIPTPSNIDAINMEKVAEEYEISIQDLFVNMIVVDVAEYAKIHFQEMVTKAVAIPKWLNNIVLEQDIDLSDVLQKALQNKLEPHKS